METNDSIFGIGFWVGSVKIIEWRFFGIWRIGSSQFFHVCIFDNN